MLLDEAEGRIVTLWLADAAATLYACAIAFRLVRRERLARVAWAAGCAIFLAHVGFAFQFYHHWSHAEAFRATARQTEQLFGIDSGFGLYFNYAFAIVWVSDVLWGGRPRAPWIGVLIHSFLAFMFFNATVVFGKGWVRWAGVVATVALLVIYGISRRRTSMTLVPVGPVLMSDSKRSKK
ncbi:MAG TPA: hypothetical protein VGP79_10905 [Bryobacteraceae bacterium]|nr:hypothetical protein [Bryobacteraceae bacterium]